MESHESVIPVKILDITKSDGPLVGAPNIIRTDQGIYYLFFSSHCYTSPQYNVKYAHAKSLRGSYFRASRPLLRTGDFGLLSPRGRNGVCGWEEDGVPCEMSL